MSLSDVEKCELRKILAKLSPEDLLSLSSTITNGLVNSANELDAVTTILKYGKKATDVLRRRKVKKSIIFEYLKEHNVFVDVNKEKLHFIKACLEYWGSKCKVSEEDMEISMEESYGSSSEASYNLTCADGELINGMTQTRLREMAVSFTSWFYDLLKKVEDVNLFGPQHFWPDCVLRVHVKCPARNESLTFSSGDAVCNYIKQLVISRRLYFHPNPCLDKPECNMNRYGFVNLRASGGLYQQENPIGVFDHIFGLVEYPQDSETTWKIKYIEMYIQICCEISFELSLTDSNNHYCIGYT